MKTKLLLLMFVLAAVMMPRGAWALSGRTANGELYKAFIYGTTKADFVIGGGTLGPGDKTDVANNMWNLDISGAAITCTLANDATLAAGDKIIVEVAFATTSSDKNKENGLKLRKAGESGGVTTFPIGDSYTTANEIVTKEFTLPSEGNHNGLVGANSFTVFRNTSSNSPGPMLRSITIIRSGSDALVPSVLSTGINTWSFENLGTEAVASPIVSDNLYYATEMQFNNYFKSNYYLSFTSKANASYLYDLQSANNKNNVMFIVPAGRGTITVNHGMRQTVNNFIVKIGTSDAQVKADVTTGNWDNYFFPYDVDVPTPVWIYSSATTTTRSYINNITVAVGGANATIGTTGYTTFSNVIPLDLSRISADHTVTAYYGKTATSEAVTLSSTDASIAAGEGLVLKGTAGDEVFIAAAESGTAIGNNKMKGCTVKTAITSATENYANFYVLSASAAEFQNIYNWVYNDGGDSRTVNIPAGKAYLDLTGVSLEARSLSISFDDETTNIEESVKNEKVTDKSYYNLSGQRVLNPSKGLYIVNGKKVMIK